MFGNRFSSRDRNAQFPFDCDYKKPLLIGNYILGKTADSQTKYEKRGPMLLSAAAYISHRVIMAMTWWPWLVSNSHMWSQCQCRSRGPHKAASHNIQADTQYHPLPGCTLHTVMTHCKMIHHAGMHNVKKQRHRADFKWSLQSQTTVSVGTGSVSAGLWASRRGQTHPRWKRLGSFKNSPWLFLSVLFIHVLSSQLCINLKPQMGVFFLMHTLWNPQDLFVS